MRKGDLLASLAAGLAAAGFAFASIAVRPLDVIKDGFLSPPDDSRPGVYWYFMDGNIDKKGITGDLESMKAAGIGSVLFLEVDVGVPRGPIDMMSEPWQDLFAFAVREAERLGIRMVMGSGPGWAGSGGPWVKPDQSMTHLAASATEVKGPADFDAVLPVPAPKRPFFGENSVPPDLTAIRNAWYEDAFVLAFPSPSAAREIVDYEEKALFDRAPYTSYPGVKPFLPALASFPETPGAAVEMDRIVDLTGRMGSDGRLAWRVPEGTWTIMRFGRRNNGAVTRPAPRPGLGFECDKFETAAFDAHFDAYLGKLLARTGPRKAGGSGGWTTIHIDSWEMGAQNWSPGFRAQFRKRRGYDPLPYLPAYAGKIVGSLERSERFLWDVRKTASELVVENHAGRFKELGRRSGFDLSIEPYDMNPAADLDLGAVADIPMGEFWSDGYGFNSAFSCIEATSIAHVHGRPVVAAEAFTADSAEAWKLHPGALKNQGDWAFAMGINRFFYHTFAHKSFFDDLRPGMTMGPYGVHWDRGQTWWPMAGAYHRYIARCQFLLSRGKAVSDILYLAPEGAPHVFRPPASALEGPAELPDKRGYAFDGCSPSALIELASVRDGRIEFPGGASYRILVLPAFQTMTPDLLEKIGKLVREGAVVVGSPPLKSPSLEGFPDCDRRVRTLAEDLWGGFTPPSRSTVRRIGLGRILWGGEAARIAEGEIYPPYWIVAALLDGDGAVSDFSASGGIRYTHRTLPDREIYFVSNRTDLPVRETCLFRDGTLSAELWDAVTGEIRPLAGAVQAERGISIEIKLEPYESGFIVFDKSAAAAPPKRRDRPDGPAFRTIATLDGPWSISFDPKWAGPASVVFDRLEDWSKRPEDGIRFYSGTAVYRKTFDLPPAASSGGAALFLDFGEIREMARVRLNGKDLGVVWTAPRRVAIEGAVRPKGNRLEIEVANLWPNRLIGDEELPDDGIKGGRWPDWLIEGSPRTSGRLTFTTHRFYKKGDPLLPSGLLGPVTIAVETGGGR